MAEKKINLICTARLKGYFDITEKAFEKARKAINPQRKKEAEEVLMMVKCYLSDAKHFQKQNHFVNAFACINYAHGWLDAAARLGIFEVHDSKLFAVDDKDGRSKTKI